MQRKTVTASRLVSYQIAFMWKQRELGGMDGCCWREWWQPSTNSRETVYLSHWTGWSCAQKLFNLFSSGWHMCLYISLHTDSEHKVRRVYKAAKAFDIKSFAHIYIHETSQLQTKMFTVSFPTSDVFKIFHQGTVRSIQGDQFSHLIWCFCWIYVTWRTNSAGLIWNLVPSVLWDYMENVWIWRKEVKWTKHKHK